MGGSGLLAAYFLGCSDGDGGQPARIATATQPGSTPEEATPTPAVSRWRLLSAAGALPAIRRDHSLVTDGERLYVFGGRGPGPFADLWIYDIAANAWAQSGAPGGPASRFGHNAVWDPAASRMLVFGGQAGETFFNDLWAFDPATSQWAELPAGGSVPAARYGAAAALDAASGRLLVSHGFTISGRFDDTWQYDLGSQSWTDISPLGGRPVERCLVRAVWDPFQQRLFIFGGQTTATPFLGDLWSFTDERWRELTRTPSPAPRNLYAMVLDEDAFRVLIFGGNTGEGPMNDLWAYDAGSEHWDRLRPDGGGPSARFSHDAVWIAATSSLFVFGGNDGSGDLNDLWELSPFA